MNLKVVKSTLLMLHCWYRVRGIALTFDLPEMGIHGASVTQLADEI